MSQSQQLITTLKSALKQQGITYAEIARHLKMSEANIKNMFASNRFTLTRLGQICELLEMELTDLVHLYEQSRQQITELTLEQEEELVKDIKLLLIAVCVRNRFTFNEILSEYQINKNELIQALAKLDRLKIIDLLPNNKIKLRITDNFRWIKAGPIDHFFEKQIKNQFLQSSFTKSNEQKLFMFGLLADSSIEVINKKITALSKEITMLQQQDAELPLDKKSNIGFLMAIRPWELNVFKPYQR